MAENLDVSQHQRASRAVATWIMIGIVMLIVQVLLGGITRLTGSGLSITEWNVVTGIVPPVNEADWNAEFEKYKQTPQYQLLNTGFTLEDFKFIFFWEWFHRFWARLIGVVFVVGFVYLLARKYIKKEMQVPLFALFLLGALQGAVGWIMVMSGLTGDAVYVKPTRLAMHFLFAMGLIAYAYWFYLQLKIPRKAVVYDRNFRNWTNILLITVIVQLIYGALMAGHRAATSAPTWPDINGAMVPYGMFSHHPALLNLLDNKITIHFIHRGIAYLLIVLVALYTRKIFRLAKANPFLAKYKWVPVVLILLQATLGILTVLSVSHIVPNHWGRFEWFAQIHQLVGMLMFLSLIYFMYIVRKSPSRYS
jgi:cytochrome c oxidase assembly protein subunit 15